MGVNIDDCQLMIADSATPTYEARRFEEAHEAIRVASSKTRGSIAEKFGR
jgi:hypothetical protein